MSDMLQQQINEISDKMNKIENIVTRIDTTLSLQKDLPKRVSVLENKSAFASGATKMMMILTSTSVGAALIQFFTHGSK